MSVTVTMLQTRRGEDGNQWTAGGQYTASDAFAAFLISSNLATGTLPVVPQTGFSPADQLAVKALVSQYGNQGTIASWYAGAINSVTTPAITADGDLSTATDQVPLKWLVVINADTDTAAAQALMDGGPNVVEVLPGGQSQPIVYGLDGRTPQVITRIYAVCISSSAVPADYTGGAYILSDLDTNIANAIANMARFDFSAGLGATVARLVATPVYNTNYTQLSVAAGVVA